MPDHNWEQLLLRIPINADKQTIFAQWTTRQGLENWFLRKAEFKKPDGSVRNASDVIQTGDTYEWMWHGWPDDMVERGTVVDVGDLSLKFTFGKAGNVTVSVKEELQETILELLQDEIPTDEHSKEYYHLGCTKGWTFFMVNLKSILEGGLDMRNRNVELKNVITA
jgi:hypothetical protein